MPEDPINALHLSVMQRQDFFRIGLHPDREGNTRDIEGHPRRPCNATLKTDADRRYAVATDFDMSRVDVNQQNFSYWDVDAADVVSEVKAAAGRCDTYRGRGETRKGEYLVDSPLTLPALEGMDAAYGYCEQGTDEKYVWWFCHVVIARGKVLCTFEVNAAKRGPARTYAAKLAPVAAELLVSATSDS